MRDVVAQRENERSRIAVDGRLMADDQQCTFMVIHERAGGSWAIYPHGVGKLGVRLAKTEVFDQLIWAGFVAVAEGDALWELRRLSLTDAGKARYAALCEQQKEHVVPPEKQGSQRSGDSAHRVRRPQAPARQAPRIEGRRPVR